MALLDGCRIYKTHGGYVLQKEYPCINGLSAWFTLATFPDPGEHEIGYTEGSIPSASDVANEIMDALSAIPKPSY